MQIKGQAAIVTGGASGIGAGVAQYLASEGAAVAVLDRNLEGAVTVAGTIGGLGLQCDVSSASSAAEAVERATTSHGPARILVNCAGIGTPGRIVGRDGPMDLDVFKRVIDVNLVGTFNVMRLGAATMMALEPTGESGERGVIVNTASVAAYEGQIGQAAYAASKGGVVSLTITAAREFAARGVRVCTIAPGLIDTPLLHGLPEEVRASLAAQVPFPKRFGRTDEFARLVGHIVDNEMLNGEVIRLDGAIRMGPR